MLFLVIWNPWDVASSSMSDFGEDEYPNMICVEAGIVRTPISLNPNNSYEGTIVLQVWYTNKIIICLLLKCTFLFIILL